MVQTFAPDTAPTIRSAYGFCLNLNGGVIHGFELPLAASACHVGCTFRDLRKGSFSYIVAIYRRFPFTNQVSYVSSNQ